MNFFKQSKEWLGNPKNVALTKLGMYGIFFIFVFILIGSGGNTQSPTYIPQETNDTVTSYEYIYKINNNETIGEITGTLKDGEDVFNYNGLNYKKVEGIIYFNDTPTTIDFDIDKYKYEKIQVLIENSDSKTTYNDDSKIVYNISSDKYFSLLNEVNNCSTIDCTIINVPITIESEKYINHVIIDLSNYYGYKYTIEINYNNINKVSIN